MKDQEEIRIEGKIEEEADEPRISFPEATIVVSLVLFAELFEFIFALTVVGIIASYIINFVVGFAVWIWLQLKGGSGLQKRVITYWCGVLLDGIFGAFLPIKTIGLIIVIYMTNHPKIEKIAERIT